MAEIPYSLTDPGAEEYYKTEIDTFPLAQSIADRLDLVAINLEAMAPRIALEYGQRIPDTKLLAARISSMDNTIRVIRDDAAVAKDNMLVSPLRHAITGMTWMRTVLINYAAYAPAVFRGYAPISTDTAWSEKLQEVSVKSFGRREERLIILSQRMEYEESYNCTTYADLCAEGLRRRLIYTL